MSDPIQGREAWRSWPAVVAVAVAYFVLGLLSAWTRIPAGFVVPLFPAAGIALVAVYLGGRRQLVAVAVAALVFNGQLQWALDPGPSAVGLAITISAGSVLQALVGARLLQAWATWKGGRRPLAVMVPAQLLGGPVACLVAAMISTATFVAAAGLPAGEAGRFFFTWWSGDTAGVVVCVPFALAVAERERLVEHLRLMVLPLSVALALVLFSFAEVRQRQQVDFENRFQADGLRVGALLQRSLDLHLEVLRGLGRTLTHARPADREAFAAVVREPLARYDGLQAFSWNPVVAPEELVDFEQVMVGAGHPDYRVRTRESGLERHVAVAFIEPMTTNAAALGFDIYSHPDRRSAILRAEVTGQVAATGPIRLVQEAGDDTGVLLLQPVGPVDAPTGFAVMVLRVSVLLEQVLQGVFDEGLRYVLVDRSPNGGQLASWGAAAEIDDTVLVDRPHSAGPFAELDLHVADRSWHLLVVAPQGWVAAWTDWVSWSVLLGGCLLVGLLGSLLAGLVHRRTEVDAEVVRKTAALEEANSGLAVARDLADAANRAKSEFLATISHEIRTPLNGVLGMARVLADSDLQPRQRQSLDVIQTSGQILLTLINDVLDLSRIEAGEVLLEAEATDLSQLVTEVGGLFDQAAEDKGLRLHTELQQGCPPVTSDPLRWRQLLFNLVGNGIKFTERGSVTIALHWRRQADDVAVDLAVRDTGIGVAPELRSHIFGRFSQADGSTTRRFGGSGLGLNICHRLVSLMGGAITVEANPAGGSVFRIAVLLPASDEALQGEQHTDVDDASVLGDARVLVVDDNSVNLLVARAALESLGLEVETAEGGEEAVARAADGFDLILMDLLMPEVDGLEATRRIRADEADDDRTRVPIVALTASAFTETREACERAGMDGHLAKPWTPEEVLAVLSSFVRGP